MKTFVTLTLLVFSVCCAFCQQPLYRYYNGKLKKHYYTVNFNEFGNGAKGFTLEGTTCLVYTNDDRRRGIIPIFRYYNAKSGDHYYTAHRRLLGQGADGYTLEGPAFYVNKFRVDGTVPLFEYYSTSAGDHFYTTDRNELGRGYNGYVFDTVIGFVFLR